MKPQFEQMIRKETHKKHWKYRNIEKNNDIFYQIKFIRNSASNEWINSHNKIFNLKKETEMALLVVKH